MEKNKHQILSTAVLNKQLIDVAASHGIAIDEISFVETKKIADQNLENKIEILTKQNIVAVFTSMNAVDAVVKHLDQAPSWKIYCIGHTTKDLVEKKFGKNSVVGIADNAEQLAELIILDNIKQVIFFCGDKRRNELPAKLKRHNIFVEELIVYTTTETPVLLTKRYDGILFLSPSAVHSFFSINKVDEVTQLFAIGPTTATAIQQYNKNNIIICNSPAKENLVMQAVAYFSTIKSDQTVL